MAESFGSTPEDFNLDDWIDQGSRPQSTVKIYRDWSLMSDLVNLEEQIRVADEDKDPSPADVGAEELREQYQELLERLAESALEVTMRAVTNDEANAIAMSIPDKRVEYVDHEGETKHRWTKDAVAIGDAIAAESTVSPRMTPEQVRRLRETLGDGPTLVLYETATLLRTIGKVLPQVPSSPGSSDDSRA